MEVNSRVSHVPPGPQPWRSSTTGAKPEGAVPRREKRSSQPSDKWLHSHSLTTRWQHFAIFSHQRADEDYKTADQTKKEITIDTLSKVLTFFQDNQPFHFYTDLLKWLSCCASLCVLNVMSIISFHWKLRLSFCCSFTTLAKVYIRKSLLENPQITCGNLKS